MKKDDDLRTLFNRVNILRRKAEFDKAADIYKMILQRRQRKWKLNKARMCLLGEKSPGFFVYAFFCLKDGEHPIQYCGQFYVVMVKCIS